MRSAELRERAYECDKLTEFVREPSVQRIFGDLARQWREIADKVERMEREQGGLLGP